MGKAAASIAYLDGPRVARAVKAGIAHLFQRRDLLNKINVFPVPDGDTGTNLAFTFKTILDALNRKQPERIDELMSHMANAALDGARGNSGAIMAQYLQGFSEAIAGKRLLTARNFATAAEAGAKSAWKAMSEPVAGTMPTVLEDFSNEWVSKVAAGVTDMHALLKHALVRARKSLANTPNQLAVLRQAGVVDAGGQGFVDFIEGIWAYVEHGRIDPVPAELQENEGFAPEDYEVGEHRYCTECVIEGTGMDRDAVMQRMEQLDSSSLVVAGNAQKIRVHIHVNQPSEVFLVAEEFGKLVQQKADDMERQHGLLNHSGKVAIVADSGADIPPAEIERLAINIVPVRLSFGEREYLDRVTLSTQDFYRMLAECTEAPKTSQPPAQDFSRVYTLLTSHHYEVLSVGLSAALSGTTSAARSAASRQPEGQVRVFDSLNASGGQGLLAIMAAEAAELGMSLDEIEALLENLRPETRVFAVSNDLAYAVKGGRLASWVKWLADRLHLNPLLTATPKGKLGLGGFHIGRGANPVKLADSAVKHMQPDRMYRVLIAHANNLPGAEAVRRAVFGKHQRIHSCHVTDAGSALGVHLGPGGLILAYAPQPGVLSAP